MFALGAACDYEYLEQAQPVKVSRTLIERLPQEVRPQLPSRSEWRAVAILRSRNHARRLHFARIYRVAGVICKRAIVSRVYILQLSVTPRKATSTLIR